MESDLRLAGPGTVPAWEETGIVGSISERLSSFPGLFDLSTEPLLRCVHGVSIEGLLSSPVMSAGLEPSVRVLQLPDYVNEIISHLCLRLKVRVKVKQQWVD